MNLVPNNQQQCLSVKNKTSDLRCPHNRKNDLLYCGVHGRSKYPKLYDLSSGAKSDVAPSDDATLESKSGEFYEDVKIIGSDTDNTFTKCKEHYSVEELLNCSNLDAIKAGVLRNTIKHLKLDYKIKLNQNKRSLFTELFDYLQLSKKYEKQIKKIRRIQKVWRNSIKNSRLKCVNITDFVTLSTICNIPSKYYCEYVCIEDNLKYGYDLRSLSELFNIDNTINPYTCKEFSDAFIKNVADRLEYLDNNMDAIMFDKPVLTFDQKLNAHMVDIFQIFDKLGNYTDHRWFSNLNIHQLKDLYRKAEDIWNYRTKMTLDVKKKIIYDGIAFTTSISTVNKLVNKSKLQYLLLDEFKRFGIEGNTIEDKKLGAILILTALVEVSVDAAEGMPQYVQTY